MYSIDTQDLSSKDAYSLLTNLIVPRPIAWVTTWNEQGSANLAPFSYFSGLCSDPPMITISIVDKPFDEQVSSREKDTLRNIKSTGIFCINLAESNHMDAVNQSSEPLDYGISELDELGFSLKPDENGQPTLHVQECRAHLDCSLVDLHRYGRDMAVSLVVATVDAIHFQPEISKSPTRVDCQNIDILGRLGSGYYGVNVRKIRE